MGISVPIVLHSKERKTAMNSVAFEPLGNRYLVLPDPTEDQSETIGDITLSTPKDPNLIPAEGTIVAKGKRCVDLDLEDKVFYGKYSGYDQNVDGVDYKVLQETEILGRRLVTPFDGPVEKPFVPSFTNGPGQAPMEKLTIVEAE